MPHRETRRPLLIVENDRALLDRLARHFTSRGFSVTAVHHPRQALATAANRRFDQAVVSRSLPEFDGVRLAYKLKQILGGMRLVMLSELEDPALRDEAYESGVDAFLPKACRMSELEASLELAPAKAS
ncbi:MAG: response regulator [Pirellulaceae bacterium]